MKWEFDRRADTEIREAALSKGGDFSGATCAMLERVCRGTAPDLPAVHPHVRALPIYTQSPCTLLYARLDATRNVALLLVDTGWEDLTQSAYDLADSRRQHLQL